ncbi:hypothetical protein ABKN59_006123 [Abortiporus biennis]
MILKVHLIRHAFTLTFATLELKGTTSSDILLEPGLSRGENFPQFLGLVPYIPILNFHFHLHCEGSTDLQILISK